MADAQNERTNSSGRRRGRRSQRGSSEREQPVEHREPPAPVLARPAETTRPAAPAPFVRPADISPPTEREEVYCTRHMAIVPDHEPMHVRTRMTTIRHLPVDHFGAATLFCDCLHNGPHEWPPTLQRLETAVELDQFINASNSET